MADAHDNSMAVQALAHFFLGLMKADGFISLEERSKLNYLLNFYLRDLPCSPEELSQEIYALEHDPLCEKWESGLHLSAGLAAFDDYKKAGPTSNMATSSILDVLQRLMEVDGIMDTEVLFLMQLREGLSQREAR
jgi:hypothetical protein